MKKSISSAFLILILTIFTILANSTQGKEEESPAIKKAKEFEDKNYVTTVSTFNGLVSVARTDEYGNIIEEYEVELAPGEQVKIPKAIAKLEKEAITWKDVADYENTLARERDPIARFVVETIWRDRINRVLGLVENKLREDYERKKKKANIFSLHALAYAEENYRVNIPVKAIADALGIDPPIGALTGQEFFKIPDAYGGRVPQIGPEELEKVVDPGSYAASVEESVTPPASTESACGRN